MATQEYYIRNESETEARGPFNSEQLSSLADTGQLTDETLVYDEASEDWVVIGTNLELKALLFPEKKKLQIRGQSEEATTDRAATDSRPPITVDEMLAAAEGRTADTKDRLDPKIAMARAASIGAWSVFIMLILSCAAEVAPSIDFVTKFQVGGLMEHPLVIFGALDLLLAVVIGLGMLSAYPVIRFRAALGLGFLGFIFFTQGLTMPFLAIIAGSAGLYLCTVTVSIPIVLVSSLVGIAGMLGVVYHMILGGS